MKKDVLKIIMLDRDNLEITEKKLTALPLKEEIIIKKSIEFYNDPEPCMIHRSAVMKRLYAELEEYFKKEAENGRNRINLNDMDVVLKNWLDLDSHVSALEIKHS